LIAQRWPKRLLVLISGYSAPSDREMPQGALFIRKPVSRRDLNAALERLALPEATLASAGT